ncbi:hypothetical protein HG536_0D00280 [Torulaspora globosa]|uniref:Protein BNI4 n=1 Tax=Torulaspora globosa TaxID=48254 RepID=A0A7G3ZG70_9SACH|nr:uncharacterized protein HG536_0D00280 [Torulaspora globosa]QLL32506.1 hypothetical protein HG536_0D00280 [Torulaspora globosa]
MLTNESYDSSDVLNSSFYSSTSINTLDHAKNFRNSLILADLDEAGYGNLTGQTSQRSEDAGEDNIAFPADSHKETATMKMSTSPSLSALAGILSEKSRQANEKLKSSELYGSATMEEEEDAPEIRSERVRDDVTARTAGGTSPNLFELNDNEEVYCPDTNLSNNTFYSTQPDFLSSPDPTKGDYSRTFQPNKEEPLMEQQSSAARQLSKSDIRQSLENQPKTQRTVSTTPTEQNQQSKKRKNFFSFLKRRNNTDILKTDSPGIPNSATFSLSHSSSPTQLAPERMTKKSYSSSNIFSTFRKNRDIKRENMLSQEHKTYKKEPINDHTQLQEDKRTAEKLTRTLPKKSSNDISKRKPTPLNYEHVHDGAEQTPRTAKSPIEPAASVSEINTIDPIITKLDTGEVRFPRSLDKQEVDSIVSIERSRSTKSNKRSSIASHRRSLTETLSANAQNEGMFIMEASSVVLSTPDLSKSPASSILRNGKFDPIEFSSNNSVMLDDQSEHALSVHSTQNALLVPEPIQNRLSMASIEERLNELTVDSEDDETPAEKQLDTENLDEDPEFMSDIMEFASIINFGDGVNFDFDSKTNTLEPELSTLKPLAKNTSTLPTTDEFIDEQDVARPGLGITYDDIIPEHQVNHTQATSAEDNEEDEFENEDFNTLSDVAQQSPQLKAFMPEFEANRPLSMSFRGLRAPSFNASVTGSSATDSAARVDHKSLASSERRQFNCVNFSSKIILYETYGEDEYDRKPDIATCNQLTPQLAQLIKAELNELKSDMEVHEDSRCYTHFF